MAHIPYSLDPPGELLALTTFANTKNLIVGALDLQGPLDVESMEKAVRMAGDSFPRFTMCLKEVKHQGRHYLVWDHQSMFPIRFRVWDATNTASCPSSLDVVLNLLEPIMDAAWDLFKHPPGQVHLVKLASDHHVLTSVISHVAADAISYTEITREVMINYHQIVTGEKPTFSSFRLGTSTGRKRTMRRSETIIRDYWKTFRYALIPYTPRCALPKGHGTPWDTSEHHVKRLLSEDESEQVVAASRKGRVSLVDYLAANTAVAIDQWNKAANTESGAITAALTVNMQRRFERMDGPNSDSVLYFSFSPGQRKDPVKLSKLIMRSRISQYRYQMDLKYYKAIAKLNKFLRIFPFLERQKVCVQILKRHQTSFALGFMGVLWPATDGRRITGDSYLTSVGGMSVAEVHGMAYKLISRTPLYLSAYFFRRRLNLILSAAAWHFTTNEARAFLDLIVQLLKGDAYGSSR